MTDERRTTAAALSGDPAGWLATLRDLLRHLRAESPDREATVEWLRESAGATDADAAADLLEFLEAAGLVAVDAEDGLRPGPHGQEFLDTHDEDVLYGALTGAVGGFGTLLESLAVRPLTDVEFGDLLEREYDGAVTDEQVVDYRQWLQALGYVEHDDGVNDLTRAGRRRVETDDDLTPPRANRPGGQAGGAPGAGGDAEPSASEVADGATAGGEPPATTHGEPQATAPGDAEPEVPAGERATGGGPDEASEPATEPGDEEPLEALKRCYDHTCMVCGDRRRRSPDEGYALVHHPMPTGEDHGGPAAPANAIVVCPNHRADFRRGLLRVDPETLEIEHAYEADVSSRTLTTVDGHDLGAQFLAYHGAVVADF